MSTPLFSVCIICRDEEKTLPKLLTSLKEYLDIDGECCVLDTGSTDKTVQVAKSFGCNVIEVGEKYFAEVTKSMAINQKFVVRGEKSVVKNGDKYFNFSEARNQCASMAKKDFVFFYDADEVSIKMDIDKINELIENGMQQSEYNFCFAYDQYGNESIKFIQCKGYDRRLMEWKGRVHELVTPLGKAQPKRVFLDESVYKLGHHQHIETGRHSYMIGLAVDCFEFPKNDRHSHYLAREMFWNQRPKSALKEFKRHIALGGWFAERAESFIFIGDIEGVLSDPEKQIESYNKSFYVDSGRNTSLIRIAGFYLHNKNYQAAIAFAKAALEFNYTGFYADNLANYREVPHSILYKSYGWVGNIPKAQEHLNKCLEYQPYNAEFLRDTQFYFEYYDRGIPGWMTFKELTWLYEMSKTMNTIVEVGSWKGRSTHALLSGCKGTVYAVDTWEGSKDEKDDTNWMAKREDIFSMFQANTQSFSNLKIVRKTSLDAANQFEDNSVDAVFIDAGHTYEEVKADIGAWIPKAKKIICGHDFLPNVWMGVIQAVEEKFGKVKVNDTIWGVPLNKNIIPKIIYTIWLGNEAPDFIQKCIKTHIIEGYEHRMITLENIPTNIEYVNKAIAAKKWVKAADYLRMWYLDNYGGIYLDADMEVLPNKNFDDLLCHQMFAAMEENRFVANSLIGSIKGHPLFKKYFEKVESNFKGDDDKYFESSMEIFTPLAYEDPTVKVLQPEYFFPYNWQTGVINVTDKTIAFHQFAKSWLNSTDLLPTVSIIIPQLGRPEGLKRCIDSIDKLYYPKHLIETIIIEGDETVPQKVKTGLEKSKGSIICYAANDIEFTSYSLYRAVKLSERFGVVSFNTGEVLTDKGNINEHFIIRKDFIEIIGGQIFDTEFTHVGVDNLLYEKSKIVGQFIRCEDAIIHHYHFSKGEKFDEVYAKGWGNVDKDRETLRKKLLAL